MQSRLSALIALALLLTLVPAAAAIAEPVTATHSENVQHVATLEHTSADGSGMNGGSDIEFMTLTFTGREAREAFDGNPRDLDVDGDPRNGVQREFALAGTLRNGLQIYDISDPENTYRTAVYDCPISQGDSQVFSKDGRTYSTYTSEEGTIDLSSGCVQDAIPDAQQSSDAYGTFIIDVTDPFAPVAVGHIHVPEGSHNGSVHPSGDFFYNSNSSLYVDTALDGGPGIEYYDISDVTSPQRLGRLALPAVPLSLGTESHDIAFNTDGTRGYSAALSQGVILDTTDPASPTIITSFVDPTINVWHQSDPITLTDDSGNQRDLLVVEDEVAGALPTGECPSGGVHIFDITGDLENSPVKVGYWNIDELRPTDGLGSCTAHVFRLHPEQGIMTIAFYNGGSRIVDLNGLAGVGLGDTPVTGDPMTQLAFYRFSNSDTWSAKTNKIADDGSFYLYANDLERGLDIFFYDGSNSPTAQAQGRWLSPAEAQAQLPTLSSAELAGYRPLCLLPLE